MKVDREIIIECIVRLTGRASSCAHRWMGHGINELIRDSLGEHGFNLEEILSIEFTTDHV